ncbi:MAG: hypothetical protein IMF09_10650 [Proteobacteria bacterium]|nr:hypothetical protein [Pseudomonadota bacterium]
MKKVAFLSMDTLDDFVCYDSLLFEPLHKLGWKAETVSWRDKQVNWNDYDVVLIRSCWDYQDDHTQFLSVLQSIEQSSAQLENKLELVNWNLDKKYLRELEHAGIKIVPTLWMSGFSRSQIMGFFEELDTQEIVIKPNISANADDTFKLTPEKALLSATSLQKIFAQRDYMVQPFMQGIVDEGEYSLFFFADEFSHCILKKPKARDFRVQEEHGGILTSVEPEPELLACAGKVLKSVNPKPLYSRVDFVRTGAGFALMELEIIEPSLYFNMDSNSAGRFARVFANWIN